MHEGGRARGADEISVFRDMQYMMYYKLATHRVQHGVNRGQASVQIRGNL